jgi:hypothetical protein
VDAEPSARKWCGDGLVNKEPLLSPCLYDQDGVYTSETLAETSTSCACLDSGPLSEPRMWQEIHVDGNSDHGNGAHGESVDCRLDRVHFSLVDSRIGMISLPHSQIGGCSPSVRTSRAVIAAVGLFVRPGDSQPASITSNQGPSRRTSKLKL